ncbi:hypothetical protein SLEP1_g35871 [Rubroshorea leprosula]|uniref:Uncharacterized protein n=1 Tax=Rubroshorea leprosula TaxID=152421 RepID=A0AAV5KPQ2_9ROSI|nr:hypothetical protein SLEP1_g35871 [Rubroshorea leprosula]
MTALSLLTPHVKSRSFRTDASHLFQSASIFLDSLFLAPPLNFSVLKFFMSRTREMLYS